MRGTYIFISIPTKYLCVVDAYLTHFSSRCWFLNFSVHRCRSPKFIWARFNVMWTAVLIGSLATPHFGCTYAAPQLKITQYRELKLRQIWYAVSLAVPFMYTGYIVLERRQDLPCLSTVYFFIFLRVLLHNDWSWNKCGICITQQMCHIMNLFHNGSLVKGDSNHIGFPVKGKLIRSIRFDVFAFYDHRNVASSF